MATSDEFYEKREKALASALVRFGSIGFWVQLIFLIIVLILGLYTLAVTGGGARIANILSFLVLGLPIFTTFWCRRYAKVGREWSDGGKPPSMASLGRMIWIGVWTAAIGAGASILSLFGAASALLLTMLANPQVGLQISPATGSTAAYTVSAIDAVSIMSLLLTLTAELIVVAISLRLAFLRAAAE
ncbi:DUF3611 family protein [Tateyamaria pelophila]|uniref:DUF3611 family protein n=1 Tax=Tateyamaria pelophila TaxID=328415 RepID=UPI001CBD7860|nr:DUF3611 family protein [Tateyamaria pelophila]